MNKKNTNNHYFENDTLIIETSKGQKIYADISAAAKAREAAEIKFFGEYAPTRCRIKEVL